MKHSGVQRASHRRKAALAAVGAGAVTVPMVFAAPASASQNQCSSNEMCVWEDGGFNSAFQRFDKSSAQLDWRFDFYQDGTVMNDTASAVWNNSDYWVKYYENIDGGGFTFCLRPGYAVSDLTTIPVDPAIPPTIKNWSNRISGHQGYSFSPGGCNTSPGSPGCSL